jgi:hypothetical protein
MKKAHIAQERKVSECFGRDTPMSVYLTLVHRGHVANAQRGVSRWNAFVNWEVKRLNNGKHFCISLIVTELLAGVPHRKSSAYDSQIRTVWNAMSPEEKDAITAECVEVLKENREIKKYAVHNVPLGAYHDARNTQ